MFIPLICKVYFLSQTFDRFSSWWYLNLEFKFLKNKKIKI